MADQKLTELTSISTPLVGTDRVYVVRGDGGSPEAFTSYQTTVQEIWDDMPVWQPIAVSDETTAITTGAGKVTFSFPFAVTLLDVYATLVTASTSGAVTVDINEESGSPLAAVSLLSTKLTIDQDEYTSATAATAAVISDSSIAANAKISIDIDGAGTGAAGLKVWLKVRVA